MLERKQTSVSTQRANLQEMNPNRLFGIGLAILSLLEVSYGDDSTPDGLFSKEFATLANVVSKTNGDSLDRTVRRRAGELLKLATDNEDQLAIIDRLENDVDAVIEFLGKQDKKLRDAYLDAVEEVTSFRPAQIPAVPDLDALLGEFEPKLKRLEYATPAHSMPFVPDDMGHLFPTITRAAEALGLGTHSVVVEQFGVDGKLFTAPDYGFDLTQRIRHEIVGRFHFDDGKTEIELFRKGIESVRRFTTCEVALGADVKPHKVGIKTRAPSKEAHEPSGFRIWAMERLDLKFPQEFFDITPSPANLAIRDTNMARLETELEPMMQELSSTILEEVQESLKSSNFHHVLDQLLEALEESEQSLHQGKLCLFPVYSSQGHDVVIPKIPKGPRACDLVFSHLTDFETDLPWAVAHVCFHLASTDRKAAAAQLMSIVARNP